MHVAITGASSGIGESLAREYAREPFRLTLVARRLERLEALAAESAVPARALRADLADLATCTDWVEAAEAEHGPIDVLINNAGIQYVEPAIGVSVERAEKLLAINLLAPNRLISRVLPGMLERKSGAIVNVSSMAGIVPTPWMAIYSASKAGLGYFSEVLRYELKGTGVHVLTVYPGPVTTPMEQAARDNLEHDVKVITGKSSTLARKIRKGVARRKKRIVYPGIYAPGRWLTPVGIAVTNIVTPRAKPREEPA